MRYRSGGGQSQGDTCVCNGRNWLRSAVLSRLQIFSAKKKKKGSCSEACGLVCRYSSPATPCVHADKEQLRWSPIRSSHPVFVCHPLLQPSVAACNCRVPRIVPAGSQFHFLAAWLDRLRVHKRPAPRQKYLPRTHRALFSKPRLTVVRKPARLFPAFAAQSGRGRPVTGRHLQMAPLTRLSRAVWILPEISLSKPTFCFPRP